MHSLEIAHAVLAPFKLGMNKAKIAQQLGIPRSTVIYMLKKYEYYGNIGLKNGRGRKKALSNVDINIILDEVKKDSRTTSVVIACQLATKTGTVVTPRSVRNYLSSAGLECHKACRKPFISDKNKIARFSLAEKWSYLPRIAWDTVIYSDECKFELWQNSDKLKVWRKKGTRYDAKNLAPTVKHTKNVMVWGCMTSKGVGNLVFIDGIMDQYKYVRILSENLEVSATKLGMSSFTFQQDNDPKHTSKHARAYFAENNIQVMLWPAQSPDLNPIEHLWQHIKRKLADYRPKNINELKVLITKLWNEIQPEVTANLVDSMPRRIEAVLRSRGGSTKY